MLMLKLMSKSKRLLQLKQVSMQQIAKWLLYHEFLLAFLLPEAAMYIMYVFPINLCRKQRSPLRFPLNVDVNFNPIHTSSKKTKQHYMGRSLLHYHSRSDKMASRTNHYTISECTNNSKAFFIFLEQNGLEMNVFFRKKPQINGMRDKQFRYSLVGQDTRLSPARPGFKSRWRNITGAECF